MEILRTQWGWEGVAHNHLPLSVLLCTKGRAVAGWGTGAQSQRRYHYAVIGHAGQFSFPEAVQSISRMTATFTEPGPLAGQVLE